MEPLKKEANPLSIDSEELLKLLAKHFQVEPEKFRLQMHYRFAGTDFGPPDERLPSIILGLSALSLTPRLERESASKKRPARNT